MKYCFIFVLLALLASCGLSEKMLCHTWIVKNIDFTVNGKNIDSTEKAEVIHKLKDSMSVTFNTDHSMQTIQLGEVENGTWTKGSTANTIYLKSNKANTTVTVNKLSDTQLNANLVGDNGTSIQVEMLRGK